ncbi:MAG TPA: CVNH domain-containing protein [Afifellaceae bacterium]|nr:CVNH domain-containing protein [Afifellaceae bacterium]
MRTHLLLSLVASAVAVAPALAQNTFQNTCSNIEFVYSGNNAALQAVCLRADGTPNPSQLVLQGISNENGQLTQGSGTSTFQQSCGNIQILVDGPDVMLSALCRTSDGQSNPTSLSLDNISNNNGNLSQ